MIPNSSQLEQLTKIVYQHGLIFGGPESTTIIELKKRKKENNNNKRKRKKSHNKS